MKVGVVAASVFALGVFVGAWGMEYGIRYMQEQYGPDVALASANSELEEKNFDRAQAHAYAGLAQYPNWYRPYLVLGNIFVQTGNIDAALTMYRMAVEKMSYDQPSLPLSGLPEELLELERIFILRKIETLMKSKD